MYYSNQEIKTEVVRECKQETNEVRYLIWCLDKGKETFYCEASDDLMNALKSRDSIKFLGNPVTLTTSGTASNVTTSTTTF